MIATEKFSLFFYVFRTWIPRWRFANYQDKTRNNNDYNVYCSAVMKILMHVQSWNLGRRELLNVLMR